MRTIRIVMMWFLTLAPLGLAGVARADACLGGGGAPEDRPPPKDASPVGMGAAPQKKQPVRLAGGGLVFVGGLGSVWLAARRKRRDEDPTAPPRS